MDKYKKLLSNTVIFAIGTFSSKVLVFLLVPLYTHALSTNDYGVVDLMVQTGNLLLPLVSLGIINAIVRYGLDRAYHKSDVFSTGMLTVLGGFCVLLLFWPLLAKIPFFTGQTLLLYVFVLMSSLRSLCSQFTRSCGYVRLYAFDGILSTATTILFNVLYLLVFKWGIMGYMLAIASADFCSVLFLFFSAKLYQYIRIRRMDIGVSRSMIRYSIPMIPSSLFWWITNVSDRYFVASMVGQKANGVYAMSFKIPTIINLVSSIFMDAWQMSAVGEKDGADRDRFYGRVFRTYQALVFTSASGLILLCKALTGLMVQSEEYYPAWQYTPFLLLATSFSCLATFLGSIYIVEKKSVSSLVTTAVGGVANILMDILLIPKYGVNGAAFATFVSHFLVFVIRGVDTRRYVKMRWNIVKTILNAAILVTQAFLMIQEGPHWIAWECGLTALMVVLNMASILATIKKLIEKRRRMA